MTAQVHAVIKLTNSQICQFSSSHLQSKYAKYKHFQQFLQSCHAVIYINMNPWYIVHTSALNCTLRRNAQLPYWHSKRLVVSPLNPSLKYLWRNLQIFDATFIDRFWRSWRGDCISFRRNTQTDPHPFHGTRETSNERLAWKRQSAEEKALSDSWSINNAVRCAFQTPALAIKSTQPCGNLQQQVTFYLSKFMNRTPAVANSHEIWMK